MSQPIKWKKKKKISPRFAEIDFYKRTVHSRLAIFGIVYAVRNFIKFTTHQPHGEDLMPYLETFTAENQSWVCNKRLEDMKWKDLVHILNAIWSFKTGKYQDFDIIVKLPRTIYDYYLTLKNKEALLIYILHYFCVYILYYMIKKVTSP